MLSSFNIKIIVTVIAVVIVAGIFTYQQIRLESLISKNTALQLQLDVAVEVNQDLNSSLTKVTDDYENKLSVISNMQAKKAINRTDSDGIKRKVIKAKDEKDITVNTANDILSRLREYQSNN